MNAQTMARRESIRVLLIEDHEQVLWGLAKLIDGEWPRMSVSATARTVAQAHAALRERDFDVVVLDVFLGADDGLRELAGTVLMSDAALLVHTGSRSAEVRRRARACGAWAVVQKDDPAQVLLDEIERAHRARRASGAR